MLPQAKKIAYLRTGPQLSTVVAEQGEADALTTARGLGRQLLVLKVDSAQELNDAFSSMIDQRPDALLIASAPFFDPAAGGLMSYGANYGEAFREAGVYAGRILKGERPADLPFQQSTKVELVVNLRTAKLLGLSIPLPLLGRADEVIE